MAEKKNSNVTNLNPKENKSETKGTSPTAGPKSEKHDKQIPNNVISLSDHKCKFTECKAKPARAGFCEEHFDWFKAGLITKDGARAADFEKKFHNYARKKKGGLISLLNAAKPQTIRDYIGKSSTNIAISQTLKFSKGVGLLLVF